MSQEASPEPRSRRTGQAWLLILIGVVAGVAGERLIVPTNSKTEVARAATATKAPLLRVGDRMVVPESSLLRSLLLVEPASVKDVARELVLPALVEADPAALRSAGLSWRKVATLRDLGARFLAGEFSSEELSKLSDEELIAALTVVPGIGPWTVQGALIIALQREDVVLPGDLALRKAIQRAYGLPLPPSSDEVLAIAEKWRPYRTLATSYLFASASERPVVLGAVTPAAVKPATR